MLKTSSLAKWGVAVLLLSSLSSCEDILEQYFPKPTPPPTIPTFPSLGLDIPFYTLSGGTKLDAYSTKDPATRTASVSITGLGSGETLLAIDFRPATGQLYGVSSASRLYVINQNTGAARTVGTGAFSPALGGNLVGFDFNPTVDRIRVVTSTGQNLRLNPETGTVAATDGNLNGAASATITGAAYTNNTAGATTTVLYDLDPATDQLYRQDPPNDGTLVPVGSLNLNISGDGGFDIDARTGTALGLYAVNGNPTLFAVDLTTGTARPLAQYAASSGYTGLAIPTQPVAYAVGSYSQSARVNSSILVVFNPMEGDTYISKPITGLLNTETLSGIDFRPSNGQLYVVTGSGRLYTVNAATAEATFVTSFRLPLTPSGFSGGVGGFDFDPVTDQIRIIGAAGTNSLLNPVDGTIVPEAYLPAALGIEAAAYDNNFAGATASKLYGVGLTGSTLFELNQPTAGAAREVGKLGPNFTGTRVHFDIGGTSNTGYVLLNIVRASVGVFARTYTINLATGTLTATGRGDLPVPLLLGNDIYGFTVGLGF
ncbi:conserved hypothetical protein [Hymenobacter roseosalivarius DSM 11622]|uniref:DUF4394 domain-containing protein n=1 Tax=Hymenobacter roseosalivarius DSM 11622 TaxID=645990 RepID=A0A1W1UV43_9BACT|nr:DUF4394 domain-containing protein [Hymenobacter roseosalivarius]SMB84681.1 conserved hypothetical protein [Hymenobacter roseosalivarius DSM 11622]